MNYKAIYKYFRIGIIAIMMETLFLMLLNELALPSYFIKTDNDTFINFLEALPFYQVLPAKIEFALFNLNVDTRSVLFKMGLYGSYILMYARLFIMLPAKRSWKYMRMQAILFTFDLVFGFLFDMALKKLSIFTFIAMLFLALLTTAVWFTVRCGKKAAADQSDRKNT